MIPTVIIDFSGHFSGHSNLKGHYIMSITVKHYINSNVAVPIERKKSDNHVVFYLV